MAPTRTREESSSSKMPSKPRKVRNPPPNEQATPGVQKIKSSLRQTRRLLAKPGLAADVKVETKRRLKALEEELQQAELSKKERALAVRYHKVKFFERQKVFRKLKQTQKLLSSADNTLKEKLDRDLTELRVDLNYIMHYPKTKKYISLFPPEVRKGEVEKVSPTSEEKAKTDAAREEIRNWIRECMGKNELPSMPESQEMGMKGTQSESWKKKDASRKLPKKSIPEASGDFEQDDFFEDDGEDNGT